MKKIVVNFIIACVYALGYTQVSPNINSGNPNFPFPQFKGYIGGQISLAEKTPIGVPHAELEQRTRDAYTILCNNMTYNVNQNGTYAPLTVNGVKYIMPNQGNGNNIVHCTCAEGDGYYLLAAAYMADKPTFDGYYMWMHDRQFHKTTRFVDNVVNSPNYKYSPGISGAGAYGASTNVFGGGLTDNSAADADVDIAMALLVAWKQWGDNALICNDPQLGAVSYKNEAIKYIKTISDTLQFEPALSISKKYISGIIGLDGYMKGGDTYGESSNWAIGGYLGITPERSVPQTNYVDYHAPAYFHSFANVLQSEGQSPWCVEQFKRAEASSDWVMGEAYKQGFIPWIGRYSVAGTSVKFEQFVNDGADFRYGWRTILNHLWNGTPTITWNPTTHQYTSGSNTNNKDMALRFAEFLQNPENAPYNNPCLKGLSGETYGGPANLRSGYNMSGTGAGSFSLNWPFGPASPSAVVSGNWDLMAQMFRECVMNWDDRSSTQSYLTSKPIYFHEWFRLLGMMVLTGNLHDPLQMQPSANMKVYKAIDKTYAFIGDTITYTISYRNYGKLDATNVIIKDTFPTSVQFVSGSSTKQITNIGNVFTWNIGTVKGFTSGNLAQTKDSVKFKIIVNKASPDKLTNQSNISCSNGSGWKSNEYPNRITDVMERNYLDVINNKAITISKLVSKTNYKQGDTLTYTVTVKNNSNIILSGGRQGVYLTAGHGGVSSNQSVLNLKYRFYHGAHEPLINYKNYRVSYFLNKPFVTWNQSSINNGFNNNPLTFSIQKLPTGLNWNQRILLNFPNQNVLTTPYISNNAGSTSFIHEGALQPHLTLLRINESSFTPYDFSKDWSSESLGLVSDINTYFPISNDWTNPFNSNILVNKIHPNQCGTVSNVLTKQLVEEWDGYTWRRIYGDSPIGLIDLKNINVSDTILSNQSFVNFISGFPAGKLVGSNMINWPKINQLSKSDSVVYKFRTVVNYVTDLSSIDIQQKVQVYPNPTSQNFNIQYFGKFVYQIFDVKGQILENGIGINNLEIGQNLKSGIYILRIDNDNGPEYIKIEKI